jgi:aminopeptidase-like protein
VKIQEHMSVVDPLTKGQEMYDLIKELYPICRSITGNGLRETLLKLRQHIPLFLHEIPSGTQVFDWTIPKEWNIRDAWVKNSAGERVIDFHNSNLHIVNYSVPIHRRMSLEELKPHLFTLPDYPDWIPYRTTYYEETWGFCLTHRQFQELREDEYEVQIDSSLEDGHLTYGEYYLPGESSDEVLFSCHACHPSLCNDNLSGVALAALLARDLISVSRRLSYRFLFIPGTIGSITWLSLNEDKIRRIRCGLVLAGVGDAGRLTYKRSRRANAEIDRAVVHILKHSDQDYQTLDFSPYGYDERQFCSPAFNLPIGRLSRSPHGTFPEYHTSADNLDFVSPLSLGNTYATCVSLLFLLENNRIFCNLNPKCEPQLGKRGLYRMMGGQAHAGQSELAMLWVLNQSDGQHTLLDIAERAALPFDSIHRAAEALQLSGLLKECDKGVSIAAQAEMA